MYAQRYAHGYCLYHPDDSTADKIALDNSAWITGIPRLNNGDDPDDHFVTFNDEIDYSMYD